MTYPGDNRGNAAGQEGQRETCQDPEEFHTKWYLPSMLSYSISPKTLFAQKHILNTTVCARACSSYPNCKFIHLSLLTANSGYLSWIYHWILSNECFLFTSFAPGGSSRHHGSEETRSSALLSRASSSVGDGRQICKLLNFRISICQMEMRKPLPPISQENGVPSKIMHQKYFTKYHLCVSLWL